MSDTSSSETETLKVTTLASFLLVAEWNIRTQDGKGKRAGDDKSVSFLHSVSGNSTES